MTAPDKPRGHVNSYDQDAPTPPIGSVWIWNSTIPAQRERTIVTEVKWNGEEWWVRTRGEPTSRYPNSAGEYWNDVGLFWETVIPEGEA